METYTFGFASVEMYRTMYQLAGCRKVGDDSIRLNTFVHARRPVTVDDAWLAAPNPDFLYSNAWLDLCREPLLLQIPDMGGRYYVLQFLDFFANTFALVGTRTVGNRARSLAIVGPNWSGSLPGGVVIVKSPTTFAWVFGRIRLEVERDLDAVCGLQDQLSLGRLAGGGEHVVSAEPWPPFRSTDRLDFFANLDQVLRRNGPPKEDAELISRLPELGMLGEDPFEPNAVDSWLQGILEDAVILGHERICEQESRFEEFSPGWIWEGLSAGRHGRDHLSRAASAKAGLGILCPEEAIYPLAYVDDQGEPLDGRSKYRLTFARGELPQADHGWSVTVYALPHYGLVKNPMARYSVGDGSADLRFDRNGSLELSLQADSPTDDTANWLPTPRVGHFVVALRVFGPSEALLRGEHRLPRVVRLHAGDGTPSTSASALAAY